MAKVRMEFLVFGGLTTSSPLMRFTCFVTESILLSTSKSVHWRASSSPRRRPVVSSRYAKHLEYGFRSHFVPGYWAGHTFVYQPGFPGGMYVGPYNGFVNGHFTLRRAIRRTKQTQDARLNRKFNAILNQRINGKGDGTGDAE